MRGSIGQNGRLDEDHDLFADLGGVLLAEEILDERQADDKRHARGVVAIRFGDEAAEHGHGAVWHDEAVAHALLADAGDGHASAHGDLVAL